MELCMNTDSGFNLCVSVLLVHYWQGTSKRETGCSATNYDWDWKTRRSM